MRLELATFLKTVTGKAVLATGIVTLGVGGAAAAGFDELPVLTSSPQGDVAIDEVPEDEAVEDKAVEDEAIEDEAADDEAADDEASVDELADSEGEPTHGQVVSDFARTTELEGCEKGQAIAELASSKAADHRQNPDKEHDPCAADEADEADDVADEEDPVEEAPVAEPTHGEIVSEFARTTELEGCEKGQAIADLASSKSPDSSDDDSEGDHDPCSQGSGDDEAADDLTDDATDDAVTDEEGDGGRPGNSGQRGRPEGAGRSSGGRGNGRGG